MCIVIENRLNDEKLLLIIINYINYWNNSAGPELISSYSVLVFIDVWPGSLFFTRLES